MLSTPPAFNLSQNQTLQFKSVAKISVGRKSESQSSFPFAIHLSMNHTDSLGAKQLFTPLRFRCQQVFFIFAKVFFRGPVGATRWREGDLCLIFKPASRTFLPSGKISFPAALSDVASSLARTALCAFSTPSSSIFPQKNLWICSLLTDYSINMPKRHRKMFAFFSSNMLPPQKSPATGNAGMGPSQCIPLPFRHLRYSATKPPAGPLWQLPLPAIDGGELPMRAFPGHRLLPATSGPLVRPYPAALLRP